MSEPLAKKPKLENKKNFSQPNKKKFLEVGQKGFLATCNFDHKDCVRECYNLLNQYANDLYGPEKNTSKETKDDQNVLKDESHGEEPSNDDIADELEKQINASRKKSNSSYKRRFQVVDTGVQNCVFIKTTLDNPVDFARHIAHDIYQTGKQKTRYLLRLVPIDTVCKANVNDIVATAGQVYDKYFLKEPTTFSVVYNKRYNKDLNRDEIIQQTANLVHAKNSDNKVDLKHAKKSLILEVIKGLCCVTVVDDYMAMRKYNLIELAKANKHQEQNSEDTKKPLIETNDNEKNTHEDKSTEKNNSLSGSTAEKV